MAKYIKKRIEVEAELFKRGMEDGYAAYALPLDQTTILQRFLGYFSKDEAYPKAVLIPAIKTLEGWYEVEEGKHYIVTGIKGERYPVEKGIFEETYEKIRD